MLARRTNMQLTGCGQHKGPTLLLFAMSLSPSFPSKYESYLYNMGNTMVIIYENSFKGDSQRLPGLNSITNVHHRYNMLIQSVVEKVL